MNEIQRIRKTREANIKKLKKHQTPLQTYMISMGALCEKHDSYAQEEGFFDSDSESEEETEVVPPSMASHNFSRYRQSIGPSDLRNLRNFRDLSSTSQEQTILPPPTPNLSQPPPPSDNDEIWQLSDGNAFAANRLNQIGFIRSRPTPGDGNFLYFLKFLNFEMIYLINICR